MGVEVKRLENILSAGWDRSSPRELATVGRCIL